MKKIQKVSFAFFIFSVFALLYIVPSVSAQVDSHMSGGQCDSNPACDPTSGTCCSNQCDPNPACVATDPNAIPCCGGSGSMTGGPNDQYMNRGPNNHGGPNNQGDPCMNMPPGSGRDDCHTKMEHRGPNDHGGPNDHRGPNDHMNRGPNEHGGPNDHGDPCMNMPPGSGRHDCHTKMEHLSLIHI